MLITHIERDDVQTIVNGANNPMFRRTEKLFEALIYMLLRGEVSKHHEFLFTPKPVYQSRSQRLPFPVASGTFCQFKA
jgi:hypothetical protein